MAREVSLSQGLHDITRALESAEASDVLLRGVLGLLRRIVPCDGCALLAAPTAGPRRVVLEPEAAPAERDAMAATLDRLLGALVADREGAPPAGEGLLAVPLVGLGRVTGVLLARRAAGGFSEHHVRVMAIVAGQLAAYLAMAAAHPVAAPRHLDGLRVLLVDDDVDIRDAFASVLEHYGATVVAVGSAAAARVELARARPDVLLCDLAMPGESGYDLMRHVAAHPNAVPAAALTAFGGLADRAYALAAGFRMQLGKPIDAAVLVAAVAELAGRSFAPQLAAL